MIGDPSLPIQGIRPFELAEEGDLTVAFRRPYLKRLESTRASAVIVPPGVEATGKPLLQVEHPKVAFARLLQLFHGRPFEPRGIASGAIIGRDCRIAEKVSIFPLVWIGDEVVIDEEVTLHPGVYVGDRCRIGAGCTLYPNVTLYPETRLGRRVILHSGTVIGADGFGYVFDGREQVKIPQTGSVIIEDDVEIGANSCVDRGTFGSTVIEKGVKLDNHVHVGHNCRVGENTILVGQVGISGSVTLGKNCVLAGHCGVVDHVTIGDNVVVTMKSAVSKDVPSGSIVSGSPAMDHREDLKLRALTRRLPELFRQVQELTRRVASVGEK